MVAGFYNYLCNRCMWPPTLKVRIPLRRGVLDPTLCDNVCSDLGQVGGFPRFSLRNSWSIVESGDKHHNHNPPLLPCRVFTHILQFLHKKATWFWICLNFHFGFSLQTVSTVLLLYIRHIVPGYFMRLVDVYSKGAYVQLYIISTCTAYSINNADIYQEFNID